MSWALVLNDAQERALSCLYSSGSPTAYATGIRLSTIRSLAGMGLVEGLTAIDGVTYAVADIDVYTPLRVTPAGFRAWADILEALRAKGP